jgi:hypothetical protein
VEVLDITPDEHRIALGEVLGAEGHIHAET